MGGCHPTGTGLISGSCLRDKKKVPLLPMYTVLGQGHGFAGIMWAFLGIIFLSLPCAVHRLPSPGWPCMPLTWYPEAHGLVVSHSSQLNTNHFFHTTNPAFCPPYMAHHSQEVVCCSFLLLFPGISYLTPISLLNPRPMTPFCTPRARY